jgi:poly(beta-D-mannuronate) lyase
MKTILYALLCCCCMPLTTQGSEVLIRTAAELTEAVATAQPGDEIIVAAGRYADWRVELGGSGSADKPIIVRPQSNDGVTFTGQSHFAITGRYIEFRDFQFEDCIMDDSPVALWGAFQSRVTNCTFTRGTGSRSAVSVGQGARENRIDNCRFLAVVGRSIQVRVNDDIEEFGIPQYNRIDHNLFQDIPPLGDNGRETIQVGHNQRDLGATPVYATVENNLFLRCNGEAEIISNKTSNNTYRNNVFRDCEGELVMRGGAHCVIEGNRFEGCTGGIRLSGTYHRVTDNVIVRSRNTGIRLLYGMTKELGGHYQAVTESLIANNTIIDAGKAGLLVGDGRGEDSNERGIKSIPPYKNIFRGNIIVGTTGDLLQVVYAPDNQIERNLFHPRDEAEVSFPGDMPHYIDPQFRDADGGDFRLSPDSPALTAGAPIDGRPERLGAHAEPAEYGPE